MVPANGDHGRLRQAKWVQFHDPDQRAFRETFCGGYDAL